MFSSPLIFRMDRDAVDLPALREKGEVEPDGDRPQNGAGEVPAGPDVGRNRPHSVG